MVCDVNIQWCCASSFLWTHTGRIPILWLYCNHSAAKFEFIFWCVKTPNVSWLTSDFFHFETRVFLIRLFFLVAILWHSCQPPYLWTHLFKTNTFEFHIMEKNNKTRLWSLCCLVLRRKRFGAVAINIPYYLHGERLSYFEFPNCSSGWCH